MKKTGWAKWIGIAAAIVLIAAFCCVTVVPDAAPASSGEAAAAQLTVAQQYCEDNWGSRILPAIDERAIAPEVLAQGIAGDLDALGAKHAARANETSPWSFCIKGTAKVVGVEEPDSKTKVRLLVDTAPYDGQSDLKVQISSVIKTNAVRDAVGFLKLDDFANQVEFAELTKAFNARIQKDVLAGPDAQALVDKEIALTGCVSLAKAGEEALVVPVAIAPLGA